MHVLKGFTSIADGNTSTLKINPETYPTGNLEKYEFTCVAYKIADPQDYGLANPVSISVNTPNTPPEDSSPGDPGEQQGDQPESTPDQPLPPKPEPDAGESGDNSDSADNNNNKPEDESNSGSGSTGGNDSDSNKPQDDNQSNSENQSKVKYINVSFSKLNNQIIKIKDPELNKIFNYYQNQDVSIWPANYLYIETAKSIDTNYKLNNSLMGWMMCKRVTKDNSNSNKWKMQIQVFSNTNTDHWFKTHDGIVANTITFTQYVEFVNS